MRERKDGAVVSYRFTHALFRQSLYEGMIAPRRDRLHHAIGRALEAAYAPAPAAHAAELAEHLARSPDPDDRSGAVAYAETATRQAMAVFAFDEAVRLLELALRTAESLTACDATRRCDLLPGTG
jgi:predicted ATPase